MAKRTQTCEECNSLFYEDTSKMVSLCPECAHHLYCYENCEHHFVEGRCEKCYWDGGESVYLEKAEVIAIAKAYIDKLNREKPFHPDYEYSFDDDLKEYFAHWYIDFEVVPKRPMEASEIETFYGAPGFMIFKKDYTVQMVSWGMLGELERKENTRNGLSEVLSEMEAGNWNLPAIRKLTGIKPHDILALEAQYQSIDFSVERNRIVVIEQIERLMKKANSW